jgi:hypothetical protein
VNPVPDPLLFFFLVVPGIEHNVNVNLLWIKIYRPKSTRVAGANAHKSRPLCLVFHSAFNMSVNRVGSGPDSVAFLFLNLENT